MRITNEFESRTWSTILVVMTLLSRWLQLKVSSLVKNSNKSKIKNQNQHSVQWWIRISWEWPEPYNTDQAKFDCLRLSIEDYPWWTWMKKLEDQQGSVWIGCNQMVTSCYGPSFICTISFITTFRIQSACKAIRITKKTGIGHMNWQYPMEMGMYNDCFKLTQIKNVEETTCL